VLNATLNVRDNVKLGCATKVAKLDRYNELAMNYSDDTADEMSRLQDEIDAENLWDLDSQIDVAMEALRCPPDDADVESLSGGERRRVALCQLLLDAPEMLLLDEPTNHLDDESIAWLQQHLIDYKGTILVVTHDRYFLDDITGWILELDRGRGIPYEGNYSQYLIQRSKRLEAQETAEARRAKFLERELEWIRMNPKARTTKNKARLKNYDKMLETEVEERDDTVELHIPAGKRLGDTVVRFEKVDYSYDGVNKVVDNLSFEMAPGDILGIVGPNGTGKTTCLKLITGRLQPQSGRVVIGQTVELCHVDQERESLDPTRTVWQEISEGQDIIKLGKLEVNSRSYVAKFNFTGQDQQQLVGSLSGGQRQRLALQPRHHIQLVGRLRGAQLVRRDLLDGGAHAHRVSAVHREPAGIRHHGDARLRGQPAAHGGARRG
jgi:ATPase subunit of ABC transporter with duplicated ATPase domains